ncbi:MAG: phosphotransferase [Bacilli bacterium]|nr:phosphotransferase [Bacilli bacterium]
MEKLTKKEISRIINNNYKIDKIINIEEINRGTADIYIIKTKSNKFLFKYFQDKYTQIEIEKEINIINFLNKRGIPTPKYVATMDNDFSIVYKNRVVILQEFIEGTTKDKNLGNEKEMLDSAMYLGKIVQALEKYDHNIEFKPSDWFEFNPDKIIPKYEELLNNIISDDINASQVRKDLNKRIEIINNLRLLDMSDFDKTSIKFSHGDYSVMQFIYKNDEIIAILDFVSACNMPIVWEIIRSYSYIDKECVDGVFNIDNLVKYVKEFQKYVLLNKNDLKYMPHIYLVQLIKSTFGYKQYLLNGNEDLLEFGILRTKMCVYLYEHAEEISNMLLEE